MIRYFRRTDPPERLARVDEAAVTGAVLLDDGWHVRPTLAGLVLTDDNLSWDEITETEARQLAATQGNDFNGPKIND